ncbi:MAG: hypothetical protein AAGI01_12640, partial [Myxococcota bacterium]
MARRIESVASLLEFFRDELERALRTIGATPSKETEAYVVHLLDGYARTSAATQHHLGFERPAALLYKDAVEAGGDRRLEATRQLGDACLFHCGVFADRLTRRGVKREYYHRMGCIAYEDARALMEHKQPGGVFAQIFGELVDYFDALAQALA